MYKYYIKLTALLTLFLSLNNCSEEFIEVTPKGLFVAETINDYDMLLNDNIFWSSAYYEIIARSFETCAVEPYFTLADNPIKLNFTWSTAPPSEPEIEDFSFNLLVALMRKIYIYNKIINEVLNATGGSITEKNSLMAQARAQRASEYFELINIYGQPFNIFTANTNLGFPIVREADATANNFVRASVEEVYNFIIEDLSIAIPLLPVNIDQRPRMTKGAAQALLGKVYVYQGKYNNAIPLFSNALAYFQTDPKIDMYDYNVTTLPSGVHAAGILGPESQIPVGNTEIIFNRSLFNSEGFSGSRALLAPQVSALYGSTDFRLHHFFTRKPFPPLPTTPEFVVPGVYRKQGHILVDRGVRLPDVYLLRAECRARTNDLEGAITDLEFLRRHRMAPADAPVPTGLSQDDLIKFVIDERTREFAIEGELWFDLRRLWHDPLFQDKKPYTHTLYAEDGTVKEIYTLTEKRLVLRFTEQDMQNNPDLINNPL